MNLEKRLSVIKERLDLASSVDYDNFADADKEILLKRITKVKAYSDDALKLLSESIKKQVAAIDANIERITSKL